MATLVEHAASVAAPARRRRLSLPEKLPTLRGKWLGAFRALWFASLALALVTTAAGLHYHMIMDDEWGAPYSDLGLRAASPDGLTLGVPIGEETRRAGIVPKSKLVAIEGIALPAATTRAEVAGRLKAVPGDYVRIRTRLPDGSAREHRLRRSGDHLKRAYAATGISPELKHQTEIALSLVVVAMLLGAAFLLYRKSAGEPVPSLLSLTLLLSIVVSEPGRSIFGYFDLPMLMVKLASITGTAFLLSMFAFPAGKIGPRWPLIATALYAILTFFPSSSSSIAALQGLAALVIVLVAVANVGLRYRRLPPGIERQQMRWAFFGFAASMGGAIVYGALLVVGSVATDEIRRIWFLIGAEIAQHVSMMLLIGGLLIALLRYRLYDAESVISRSTGYAVLTLMVGATFTASTKGLEWVFEANFGREAGALSGAAGAGLAVLLVTPLHNRVHAWAERRFQKALLHLRRDLPLCVGDLRETAGMPELLGTTLSRIGSGVRAARSAVLLREDGGWNVAATRQVDEAEAQRWSRSWTPVPHAAGLSCESRDPLFPLRIPLSVHTGSDPETIGWILLGPRPDGSFYGKDEQEALAEIADPVARAVQIVLLREAREAEARAAAQRQENRIAALERKIVEAFAALRRIPGPVPGVS